jgi:lipopolysaccharide-induced tumor necrosis factor-alpha factor
LRLAMANAVKPAGESIGNGGEPQLGIPYPGPAYGYPAVMTAPPQQMPLQQNPYSAGMRPPNAMYGIPPPPGMGLQETFFADTPAPFECPHCGQPGLTNVKSSLSTAAWVGCLATLCGLCFLTRSCDCLWHKHHYCDHCGQKVADYTKDDPCIFADPMHWTEPSYAVPA